MAVTSQARAAATLGELKIADWTTASFIKPSVVKPVITTIEETLVIRRLRRLKTEDQEILRRAIGAILG